MTKGLLASVAALAFVLAVASPAMAQEPKKGEDKVCLVHYDAKGNPHHQVVPLHTAQKHRLRHLGPPQDDFSQLADPVSKADREACKTDGPDI